MSRVSQAEAQANRERTVAAAARLFRERGVQGVSVADVMKSVGLTHGGFYKQFASKEALLGEATERAYSDLESLLASFIAEKGDNGENSDAARAALIDFYLSADHRDNPGAGCPTAGFAGDMAREPSTNASREQYANGICDFAKWLTDDEEEGLATVCTMVGALLLARATSGTPLSDEILAAARTSPAVRPGTS